jgi:hypothetical protein
MASLATTGSSTGRPSARINEAIETCCKSTPSTCIIPKVIDSVSGIDAATSRAERHSRKPMSATSATSKMASIRLRVKSPMFSSTCSG